ncbi:glycoside hydrolase family 2 TIM barrel-domain containing protein [Porticoccus sp. W117]|uniref:glycoside hydrolase family 2 TIM barrel-domain containing protein n=1 Tax=Porticoccus sp. W117 TaxID=3054777 RepID=UPI002598971B|nr:glycoside hydrolase family 2 TIM barrel-domain containing protein [Porticoccus sp. W117]MDM3870035.1 glycoside hydrolase family 2 TIM barrel-domain containing protein [Porticoccus sp. W117]
MIAAGKKLIFGLSTAMLVALFCMPVLATQNASQAIKVEVVQTDGVYSLLRGGQPYHVKGAGIDDGDIDAFAKHGGNSFRTWSVVDGKGRTGQELLDKAQKLGLTVSLNLPLGAEHWGFDYSDEAAVAAQFEEIKKHVLKYKDHPALLTWIIGNELNYDFTNPKVFDAINDIAKMIKEVDPNHPTTTTLAGFDKRALAFIEERASALDFVSFQMYGSLVVLPKFLKEIDYKKPFFVTEWGAVGHWEVGKTLWKAPVEFTSSEKADNYLKGYTKTLESVSNQLLGNYVFLWGQKQERTPTWYSMFLKSGESTETVDVMHYIWNDKWPENRAPIVKTMLLKGRNAHSNIALSPNQTVTARFLVKDPDKDKLRYRWELMFESKATEAGGAKEVIPPVITGLVKGDGKSVKLTAPGRVGAYRLFAYAYDDKGHVAHANIPFYVTK